MNEHTKETEQEHSKQDVRCGCCGYMTYHREHMGCIRAAEKTVLATKEVPMPEPVAYGFGNTAITGHTNRLMMVRIDIPGGDQYAGAFWLPLVLADEAHTYGVACRAAGEAAGYARGREEAGRDAERYQWLCNVATEQQWVELGGYTLTNIIDDYIDAAMRREVKP